MSQARNFSMIALCAVLLLAAGCKDKNAPQIESLNGAVNTPSWQSPKIYDMTSTMTPVVKIDFTQSFSSEQLAEIKDKMTDGQIAHEGDLLAAFSGNTCLGVDTLNADQSGLFYLFISTVNGESAADIQLRYYSTQLRNIFITNESFTFSNDGTLGSSVNAPYTPTWRIDK